MSMSVDCRCTLEVQKYWTRRIFAWITENKTRIQTLNVSGMRYVHSQDVQSFKDIAVKHLIMRKMKFSYIDLEEFLFNFQKLETLDLSQSCFSHTTYGCYLGNLQGLRELDLHGCSLSDTQLLQFGSLARLEKLDLSNNQITDQGVSFLASWFSLVVLDVSENQITNQGLEALQVLPSLQDVEAFNTKICEPLSFNFRVWLSCSHDSLLMRLFSSI